MQSIKLIYGRETRIREGAPSNYEELVAAARRLFNIDAPIKLLWTDEEGDEITCTSDEELNVAFGRMSFSTCKKLPFKFKVILMDEPERSEHADLSLTSDLTKFYAIF